MSSFKYLSLLTLTLAISMKSESVMILCSLSHDCPFECCLCKMTYYSLPMMLFSLWKRVRCGGLLKPFGYFFSEGFLTFYSFFSSNRFILWVPSLFFNVPVNNNSIGRSFSFFVNFELMKASEVGVRDSVFLFFVACFGVIPSPCTFFWDKKALGDLWDILPSPCAFSGVRNIFDLLRSGCKNVCYCCSPVLSWNCIEFIVIFLSFILS